MAVETLMYAVLSLPAAACAVAWLRVEWLAEHGVAVAGDVPFALLAHRLEQGQ